MNVDMALSGFIQKPFFIPGHDVYRHAQALATTAKKYESEDSLLASCLKSMMLS